MQQNKLNIFQVNINIVMILNRLHCLHGKYEVTLYVS